MLLTFNGLDGNEVHINPALVEAVTTFNWVDHDMELPDEYYHMNKSDLKEIIPSRFAEAEALRTFPRTIITTSNGTFIVKEAQGAVLKAVNFATSTTNVVGGISGMTPILSGTADAGLTTTAPTTMGYAFVD